MSQEKQLEKEIKLESEQLQYLKQIDNRLYRLTSLKWNFLMGLMRGVSTVIGATIIAGIVFGILARMISSVDSVPFINQLIENSGIEQTVRQQVK
jgi:hypothetical protein